MARLGLLHALLVALLLTVTVASVTAEAETHLDEDFIDMESVESANTADDADESETGGQTLSAEDEEDLGLTAAEKKALFGYIKVRPGEKYLNKVHPVHNLKAGPDGKKEKASKPAPAPKKKAPKKKVVVKAPKVVVDKPAPKPKVITKTKVKTVIKYVKKPSTKKIVKKAAKAKKNMDKFNFQRWHTKLQNKIKKRVAQHHKRQDGRWGHLHKQLRSHNKRSRRAYRRFMRLMRRKVRRARRAAKGKPGSSKTRVIKKGCNGKKGKSCKQRREDRIKARKKRLRWLVRRWRSRRRRLRRIYMQMFKRYLILMARFYRRKYRTLVIEYIKEHRQNNGLKRALNALSRKLAETFRYKRTVKQLNQTQLLLHNEAMKAQAFRKAVNKLRDSLRRLRAEMRAQQAKARRNLAAVKHAAAHKRAALAGRLAAQAAAARVKHQKLQRAHNTALRNFRNSVNNAKKLRGQVGQLKGQLSQLQKLLAAQKAQSSAAARAAANKAAAANKRTHALDKKFKAALKQHGALQNTLNAQNRQLRDKIKRLQKRCIPDVCGVCGGDESSCRRVGSARTCHTVGDPHFRSFDGYTFDYQVTGEFILAKHLWDFEVQNLQSKCPNPRPRCNKAIAVKADGHIIINYAHWGGDMVMIDGKKIRAKRGRRTRVSQHLTFTTYGSWLRIRYRDAQVRAYIRPWGRTQYMDLYVTAPRRWSSGRSLTGLCGNFDGNGNDRYIFGIARRYWVAGSKRSLFRNPRPTMEAEADLEEADHTNNEESEEALSERGGPLGLEAGDLGDPLGDGTDLPADDKTGEGEEDKMDEDPENPENAPDAPVDHETVGEPDGEDEKPPNHRPHHNVKLAFKDAAQAQEIKRLCGQSHGADRRACEFDVLAGAPAEEADKDAKTANLLDHERLLAPCLGLESPGALTVESQDLPKLQKGEGLSIAFWWQPTDTNNERRNILSIGTSLAVSSEGNRLVVEAGGAECTANAALVQNAWSQWTVVWTKDGTLNVYANGNPVQGCTASGDGVEIKEEPFEVGQVDQTVAQGRVARLFYVPLTVTSDEVKRYSQRQPPTCAV